MKQIRALQAIFAQAFCALLLMPSMAQADDWRFLYKIDTGISAINEDFIKTPNSIQYWEVSVFEKDGTFLTIKNEIDCVTREKRRLEGRLRNLSGENLFTDIEDGPWEALMPETTGYLHFLAVCSDQWDSERRWGSSSDVARYWLDTTAP